MVRALQLMFDRNVTSGEIDQAARNEERRNPARALFFQQQRRIGDARQAANAGADQNTGAFLRIRGRKFQTGISNRLISCCHRIDDEIIDLALLFRLHPIVGIEFAVSFGATRHEAGDLAGDVGNFKFLDPARPVMARQQIFPCRFHTAANRCDEP